MPAIVNENLAGFTVTYNGVQFGGADSQFKSLPPMYSFEAVPRHDRSGRAVMMVDVNLQVRCIFYETSEGNMTNNMAAIQVALSTPGRSLTMSGLGSGFGIATAGVITADVNNGPKPGPVRCTPIGGQLAWELAWSVQFGYVPCASGSEVFDAFMEFSFNTTWNNDFEGLATRTISGLARIKQHRDFTANPDVVVHVAEELRDNFVISVPTGFRRVNNSWRESDDKAVLEFTIVDEELRGDPLPDGVTMGNASFSFSSGDGKGGFATALCVLSMTLRTAPNVHRDMAGKLFLAAVLSKQGAMATALGNDKQPIPLKLDIVNHKFEDCRVTQCQMVWQMTAASLSTMLTAAGIWQPVSDMIGSTFGAPQDYNTWKAGMNSLWANRGFSGLTSNASEAVIIDLCDNVNSKTIGVVSMGSQSLNSQSLPSITCPSISASGGWINWDLQIVPLRKDNQTHHRRAAPFLPESSLAAGDLQDPSTDTEAPSGGPSYSQSGSDQDIIEYQGYPEHYVGMKFRALRYVNTPFMPVIKSISGNAVYQVHEEGGQPQFAFDAFGCPVWYIEGVRVYKVVGQPTGKVRTGSAVSLGASLTPTGGLEL